MSNTWRNYLAVGSGGMVGAVARYELGKLFVIPVGGFPFGTLVINLSGSFVLGFFLTLIASRIKVADELRLFFATGIIGAYTTFSTFTSEVLTLWRGGFIWLGLLYSLVSLLGGLLFVWLGYALARRF
jgi:CrcB protein